ncbi:HNH endonuclease [Leptospira harrisiae]|uniref:HNH endonuclease n=1 Tax=Leptospira harrisiae TaxID=2023189 RepID=UPI000C29D5EF|nr:HNH endonuclease [Leptospira harrisiae]PKA10001.1 hypothetical protein CH366_10105 [Leptospira harrisiae]
MFIFSKKQIPYFYFSDNWVRRTKLRTVYNSLEFQQEIAELENYKNQFTEIDQLSNSEEFLLAIFIEAIKSKDKITISHFEISKFYWKIHDAIYVLNKKRPSEAVRLDDLPELNLEILKSDSSCLPFLLDYATLNDITHLNFKLDDLKKEEKIALTRFKIELRKNQISNRTIQSTSKSVTPKIRQKILFRDNSRCLLCGRTSKEVSLHVDHIIPKNIIKRLALNSDLLTAEYNLMSFCFECNLGKSGDLTISSIEYYQKHLQYEYFKPTIDLLIKLKDLPRQ